MRDSAFEKFCHWLNTRGKMVFGWLKAGLRRADAESRGANAGLGTGGGLEYATSGMVAPSGLGFRDAAPAAEAHQQAQQLLASVKWCPRLDTADAASVRSVLRDAVDLAGLRQQADGVAPPSVAEIQLLMQDIPGSSVELCEQLHRRLMAEFWHDNTRLYYLLRPVVVLRGSHAAADAREIERVTIVGQSRCGYSLLKWMLSFDVEEAVTQEQRAMDEEAQRTASVRRLATLCLSASATQPQLVAHANEVHDLWVSVAPSAGNAPQLLWHDSAQHAPVRAAHLQGSSDAHVAAGQARQG